MIKIKLLTLISLFVLFLLSCSKDELVMNKYERPTWLAGKLYTQILSNPELSTFGELLHISGYDSIINVSGSYTVFAPSNDAFKTYFQENPIYNSVTDIPKAEVLSLVKYHLVQNAWSKIQLRSVDIYGWIDTLDLNNNLAKGYKRETLLLNKNRKHGVEYSRFQKQNSNLNRTNIIDTTLTSWHRRVYTPSRKYVPIFYKEYFNIYDLPTSDYSFYFNRPFENNNDLYYGGGRIISDEVFAENGFVYTIDRVVEPLKNGFEILSDETNHISYKSYLNLVNQFAEMDYNESETNKQSGVAQGLKVDSLFNLKYPYLTFDITSERTQPPKGTFGLPGNVTTRYQYGIIAPTDEAFNQLISKYLSGPNSWGSLTSAPENIKRIIANSSLSADPIYPTNLIKGFLNGEADNTIIDEASIVQKEYGSNCTFIGVDKPIVPRAFISVTGPVYLQVGFFKVMCAIEAAGLLPALKTKGANYSFFVESDIATSSDSSFMYDLESKRFYALAVNREDNSFSKYQLYLSDLRNLLLNHIGLDQPIGIARKEFIKNMAGNYLIFDNVSNVVQGTAPTTYGYRGSEIVNNVPRKISTEADNGTTYEIDNWFSFNVSSIYMTLSIKYPQFHQLLKKAGLSQDNLYRYSFLSDNQSYTVFVPSDSVLNVTNTDAMSLKELKNFLLLHFIQGDIIFTDGNKQTGYYETARIDESSTPFITVSTKIKIETGIDKITIPSKDNTPYLVVNESPTSNILTGILNSGSSSAEVYPNVMNNGVIHEIKRVLLLEEVDTN